MIGMNYHKHFAEDLCAKMRARGVNTHAHILMHVREGVSKNQKN